MVSKRLFGRGGKKFGLVDGHQIGSRGWPLLCRGKNSGRPFLVGENVFLPGFGHGLDGTGSKSQQIRKT